MAIVMALSYTNIKASQVTEQIFSQIIRVLGDIKYSAYTKAS